MVAMQVGATVSWEPRIAMPTLDWLTVFTGLLMGLAAFGSYRFLTWLVAKRQSQAGWKSTRYLWPATMLVVQWAIYPVTTRGSGEFSWLMALALSVIGCVFWHIVIRLLEWRNELAESTTLNLTAAMRR